MRSRRRKLGLAFTDEMHKISRRLVGTHRKKITDSSWEDYLLPHYQSEQSIQGVSLWRSVFLGSFFLVVFFGLFLRLFHLQIVSGKENRERADLNRIQMKVIHAPRGVIYDRNGKVLAENSPGFRLKRQFLTRDEALALEARNDPQFNKLEMDTIRYYPLGEVTSHVLGYVSQVSDEELQDSKIYKLGDHIGRVGIEKTYENYLRGVDGAEIIEVDASGNKLRSLRKIDPTAGKNLYLALDADLQKAAYQALKDGVLKVQSCCGVAVAVGPQTGEILALVSFPSYDNNAFTDPKRSQEISDYFSNNYAPLLNRVIGGVYPPGSTFKIVSALAGLSTGKITITTQFEDTGVMHLGPYSFANWYFTSYGKTEGLVDVVKALQRSNDIYFYKVGDLVGEKTIGETAKKLGFGKKLGIDIPGEIDGLIPDAAWKEKNVGEVWYPGDNLHMAIGQGFLLTTPLQVLASTSFVAAEGNLVLPHLVTKIVDPRGGTLKEFKYEPVVGGLFKKEDLNLVKKGLSLVPKEGGTAWPFFTFSIPTAGKTGTAEFGDPQGKTHAWYTSYAPEDDPKIALTVLVEAGGEGSSVASPIAKDIYTWYFNTDKTKLQSLDIKPIATESARTE